MTDHPKTEDAQSRTASVLVVDDDEANRALTRATLEDEGYRVTLAAGGAEGVAAFERERPDCVLLDVRMPRVDGFAACARIRALPGGPETPLLFLTAQRDVDTFDRAVRAGADDFLSKPIRPAELLVRVDTALKVRRMRTAVREYCDLFKNQRDALVRVQLQKERLMSFVVHDLTNPINMVDLHAQALLRVPELPQIALDSVTHIRREASQLARMILNLLDLSKADEGKLVAKRADVDASALVAAVVDELQVAAQARRVRLETTVDASGCEGDEDLLRRVLANLVENALRYAPKETTVRVTVRSSGDATELKVADSGKGVPPELRERIFEPFVQSDRSDGRATRTGRGLGLTFCKLAVEAHGGRIWVEDAAPGASFCVSIPRRATVAA